jgi:hypothetical protein
MNRAIALCVLAAAVAACHDAQLSYTDPTGGALRLVKNSRSTGTAVVLDFVVGDRPLTGYSTGFDLPLAAGRVKLGPATPGTVLDPGTAPVAASAALPGDGPLRGMLVIGLSQKATGAGAVATARRGRRVRRHGEAVRAAVGRPAQQGRCDRGRHHRGRDRQARAALTRPEPRCEQTAPGSAGRSGARSLGPLRKTLHPRAVLAHDGVDAAGCDERLEEAVSVIVSDDHSVRAIAPANDHQCMLVSERRFTDLIQQVRVTVPCLGCGRMLRRLGSAGISPHGDDIAAVQQIEDRGG